jgi:hypothetical protein
MVVGHPPSFAEFQLRRGLGGEFHFPEVLRLSVIEVIHTPEQNLCINEGKAGFV